MIREITADDIPELRALEHGYAWKYDQTFAGGLAWADGNGKIVMAVGAWRVAEVHALQDSSWGCPGMREAAFQELHEALAAQMKSKGFGEAITFFDTMQAKCRRLVRQGWVKITKHAYGKAL